MNYIFLLSTFAIFLACSSNKESTELVPSQTKPYLKKHILSERSNPPIETQKEGQASNSSDSDVSKTPNEVILLITNDLYNNFEGVEKKFINTNTKKYSKKILGGLKKLHKFKRIIEKKYKRPTLLVDAGNFSNPNVIPSKASHFFKELNYQVIGLGKNEFKIKFPYSNYYKTQLFKLLASVDQKIILSNLKNPFVKSRDNNFSNLSKPKVVQVGALKLGFINVIQPDFSLEISPDKLNGYILEHFHQSIKAQLKTLDQEETNFNILIANSDISCPLLRDSFLKFNKTFDPNSNKRCIKDSYLYKQLSISEKERINLILGSGSGGMLYHKVSGIPYVQNPIGGRYASAVKITFDGEGRTPQLNIYKPILLK